MEDLIIEHYPDPLIFTYAYLRSQCEQKCADETDVLRAGRDHLEDLEISGLIKLKGNIAVLRENGKWLCDPPEVKHRRKKRERYMDPKVESLADLVGYPVDWHNRGKYEKLFRSLTSQYEWSIIKDTAEYFQENKKDPQMDLSYFLTLNCFKSVRYYIENPEEKAFFRTDLVARDDEEMPF